jgi:hypothetical protein
MKENPLDPGLVLLMVLLQEDSRGQLDPPAASWPSLRPWLPSSSTLPAPDFEPGLCSSPSFSRDSSSSSSLSSCHGESSLEQTLDHFPLKIQ